MRSAPWIAAAALLAAGAGALVWWPRDPASRAADVEPRVDAEAPAADGLAPRLEGRAGGPRDAHPASAPVCPEAKDQPLAAPATVELRVLGDLRKPVVGATVSLAEVAAEPREHEPVRTDREGTARWSGILSTHVRLDVTCPGYFESDTSAGTPLTAGETRRLEIRLFPQLRLPVRVVRAEDGEPIAGARVFARMGGLDVLHRTESWGEQFETRGPVETDERGIAALRGLSPEVEYGIWAEADGRERGERGVLQALAGEAPALELRLRPGGSFLATVRTPAGAAVPDVEVSLVPKEIYEAEQRDPGLSMLPEPEPRDPLAAELRGNDVFSCCGSSFLHSRPLFSATTGPDGSVRIDGLPLDRTFVLLRQQEWTWPAKGLLAATEDVRVTAAVPVLRRDLRWEEWGAVRVRALDAGSKHLKPFARLGDESHGTTEKEEGWFLLERVAPGIVDLTVWSEGFVAEERRLDVRPGVTLELELRLQRGGVQGRLTDPEGRPVPGAWVSPKDDKYGGGDVDPETGAFTLQALRSGTYRLRYGAPGVEPRETDVSIPASDLRLVLPRVERVRVEARLVWTTTRPRPEEFHGLVHPQDQEAWWSSVAPVEAAGSWRRWDLLPGAYTFSVLAAGCTLLEHRFDARAGQPLDLGTLSVPLRPPVEGEIRFRDGSPARGARVHVRGLGHATAGDDGRFRFEYGPHGSVTAVAGWDGCPAQLLDLPKPGPGVSWRIVLETGGRLDGRVEGRGDTSALRIEIAPADGSARPALPATPLDSAGRFAEVLVAGRYRVNVRSGDELLASSDVRILDGETAVVVLPLAASER